MSQPEEQAMDPRTADELYQHMLRENRFRIANGVVADVASLQQVLENEVGDAERWVFRGQRDWEWDLQPKQGRRAAAPDEFPSEPRDRLNLYDELEKEIFEDWQAEAVALVPPSLPRPSTPVEWLAIAQHHGLSTRLLDWSRNPLIGTYFAVQEAGTTDGALFALRGLPNLDKGQEHNPWGVQGIRLWHPPSIVDRIGRQSGVFTLHQTGERGRSLDLIAYASGTWQNDPLVRKKPPLAFVDFEVVKIRIAGNARGRLRAQLRHFGVDEFFAFPDLGGLCRAYESGRFRRPGFAHLLRDLGIPRRGE